MPFATLVMTMFYRKCEFSQRRVKQYSLMAQARQQISRLLGTVTFAQRKRGDSSICGRCARNHAASVDRSASTSPQAAVRSQPLMSILLPQPVEIEAEYQGWMCRMVRNFPPALGRCREAQPWRALDRGRFGRDRGPGRTGFLRKVPERAGLFSILAGSRGSIRRGLGSSTGRARRLMPKASMQRSNRSGRNMRSCSAKPTTGLLPCESRQAALISSAFSPILARAWFLRESESLQGRGLSREVVAAISKSLANPSHFRERRSLFKWRASPFAARQLSLSSIFWPRDHRATGYFFSCGGSARRFSLSISLAFCPARTRRFG